MRERRAFGRSQELTDAIIETSSQLAEAIATRADEVVTVPDTFKVADGLAAMTSFAGLSAAKSPQCATYDGSPLLGIVTSETSPSVFAYWKLATNAL